MSAWWEPNRQTFVALEMLLILVSTSALLAWQPHWNVTWALLSFVIAFGVQRLLVLMGAPSTVTWKLLMIIAVVLVAMAIVASRGGHDTFILWSATGFLVGAWSGREEGRRGQATG